jgi:hypothetical protein
MTKKFNETVMISNFTDIYNMNNPFSPETIEHKKYQDMTLEIHVRAWDTCGRV